MLRIQSPKNETIMNLISSAMSWSIYWYLFWNCCSSFEDFKALNWHQIQTRMLINTAKEKCYRRSVWVFLLVKTAISWYIFFFLYVFISTFNFYFPLSLWYSEAFIERCVLHRFVIPVPVCILLCLYFKSLCPYLYSLLPRF